MNKRIITLITLVFLLSLVSFAQDTAKKADELINAYLKQGQFSGSVLIAERGKTVLSKGYGMSNYELDVPNTTQTKFRIGSITKQFTSMAIMQLVERGVLNVEDPITKYLPDYPKAVGDKITIHRLLTHTSGVFDYTETSDFDKKDRIALTLNELIATFKDKPLDFEPGTKFKYSNSGYVLLTAVIEKVSGKSYEQYLMDNIFQPLGMKNTGYDHSEIILKNRAAGYNNEGKELKNADFIDMSLPTGAGSLYSTIEDLYVWDRALYTEKLVKKTTLDKIFTPDKGDYAYGWVVDNVFNHKRIWHNGGINGFNAHLTRLVNDDICIVVLSNRIPSAADKMGKDLAAVILGEKYNLPVERKEVTLDPKVLDRYVGEFEISPTFSITILREDNKLMAQATGQPKFEIYPESETKFFLKVVDAQIGFVKNEKGEITGFILYQGERETPGKKVK